MRLQLNLIFGHDLRIYLNTRSNQAIYCQFPETRQTITNYHINIKSQMWRTASE